MKTFEIRLTLGRPRADFTFSGKGFIVAMHCHLAKEHGGACHGEATDSLLIAQIRAPEQGAFIPEVEAWADAERRRSPDLKLLVIESPKNVLTPEQEEAAREIAAIPTKLTRKFFFSLAPGKFVASNVWNSAQQVAFSCRVAADVDERQGQWQSAVECGAAQRFCRVFQTEEHFRHWLLDARRYFGIEP